MCTTCDGKGWIETGRFDWECCPECNPKGEFIAYPGEEK